MLNPNKENGTPSNKPSETKIQTLKVEYNPKMIKKEQLNTTFKDLRDSTYHNIPNAINEEDRKEMAGLVRNIEIVLDINNGKNVHLTKEEQKSFLKYLSGWEVEQLRLGGKNSLEIAYDIQLLKSSFMVASGDLIGSDAERVELMAALQNLKPKLNEHVLSWTKNDEYSPATLNNLEIINSAREKLISIIANPIGNIILTDGEIAYLSMAIFTEKSNLISEIFFSNGSAEFDSDHVVQMLDIASIRTYDGNEISYLSMNKLLALTARGNNIDVNPLGKLRVESRQKIYKMRVQLTTSNAEKQRLVSMSKEIQSQLDFAIGLSELDLFKRIQKKVTSVTLDDLFSGKSVRIDTKTASQLLQLIRVIEYTAIMKVTELTDQFGDEPEDPKLMSLQTDYHLLIYVSMYSRAKLLRNFYPGFTNEKERLLCIVVIGSIESQLEGYLENDANPESKKEYEKCLGLMERISDKVKNGTNTFLDQDEISDLTNYFVRFKLDTAPTYKDAGTNFANVSHAFDQMLAIADLDLDNPHLPARNINNS